MSSAAVIKAVAEQESAEQTGQSGSDGFVTAVVPIESLEHARAEFLRFGPTIEVLGPPELRDLIAVSARELSEIYPR